MIKKKKKNVRQAGERKRDSQEMHYVLTVRSQCHTKLAKNMGFEEIIDHITAVCVWREEKEEEEQEREQQEVSDGVS